MASHGEGAGLRKKFQAITPEPLGGAASAGELLIAARADHVHDVSALATSGHDHPSSYVAAYMSADMAAVPALTWTTLQIGTETHDSGGEYDPTTYTFTPSENGLYLVNAAATMAGSLTSWRNMISIWEGTSVEVRRLADGELILVAGTALLELEGGVGYTVRVQTVDSSAEVPLGGASYTYVTYVRMP